MSSHSLKFYQTTIGKKVIMAVSGLVLIGFVIGHMVGNLQILLELVEKGKGQKALDAYAALLHSMPALLWTARIVLLASIFAHFWAAISLVRQNRAARPQAYARQATQVTTYAAKTMKYGGFIVLFFIIYHLLHLTLGTVAPEGFKTGKVYANVVSGFQNPAISGFYIVAQLCLGLHLHHGVWSLMQTLGLNHENFNEGRRLVATSIAGLITFGNISIPVAVLAGLLS
jgi:succinate dehydrogenase / fumarate reductase cytochrome b subunit